MAEDKKVKVIEEEEEGVEEKKVPSTKVYHVSKRAEDKKWTIKFALGSKVIKLCDTKEEALAYATQLATKQDGVILVHASKGKQKGKIMKK